MLINTDGTKYVRFVPSDQLDETRDLLLSQGWRLFFLTDVTDAVSLFTSAIRNLPLDPPLSGMVNWNAFPDSIWYGLAALGASEVAIFWPNADTMKDYHRDDFDLAVECLTEVAQTLDKERDNRKSLVPRLRVFLFGTGKCFSDFVQLF